MRTLFTAACLLAASSGLIQAGSYKSLEIKKVDNTVAVVTAENLTLTIDGNQVLFSNPNGQFAQMRADEIAQMQFTDEEAGIAGISVNADGPATAYTLGGAAIVTFSTLNEAINALPAGAYIINCGNAPALKIYVGK